MVFSNSKLGATATAAAAAGLALLAASAPSSVHAQSQVSIDSYAPVNVTCPSRSLLRSAGTSVGGNQSINPSEATYIESRRQNVVGPAFEAFLANNITGYDLSQLAPNASYCE